MREAVGGMDERVRRARLLYERAVFSGDPGPLADADVELDAAEADLAAARGQIMHTRFLRAGAPAPTWENGRVISRPFQRRG